MISNSSLNADLHCHSVVSDGTLTPEQLAERAYANGVRLWALTDHDELGVAKRGLGLQPVRWVWTIFLGLRFQ